MPIFGLRYSGHNSAIFGPSWLSADNSYGNSGDYYLSLNSPHVFLLLKTWQNGRLGMADMRRIYDGHTADIRQICGGYMADLRPMVGRYAADIRQTCGGHAVDMRRTCAC